MCFDRRICLSHASVGSRVCSAIYRRSHTSLTELLHVTQDKKRFISRTGPALVYQRASYGRRLGCGSGRRLETGSCVYLRDDPDGLSAV